MPSVDQTIRIYEDLANWYERQGQAKLRDWFLVLAADAAQTASRPDEAERFRARLLQINPHHLLKPFASMADALKSHDVHGYVAELRRAYPPQAAEQLLESQKGAPAPPRVAAARGQPAPRPQAAEPRAAVVPPTPVPAPAAEEEAPLKVYRVQDMPEQPSPSPPSRQPSRPLSSWEPATPPAKAATNTPPPAPRPRPAAAPSPALPGLTRQPDNLDHSQGRWVSSALFGLMVLFSLLLAAYCFARPYLPAEWIPS
jgi:hypothetical protein